MENLELKRFGRVMLMSFISFYLQALGPLSAQVVSTDERPIFIKSGNVVGVNERLQKKGKKKFTYTNPITSDTSIAMRDHFIIRVGNKWYATGTSLPVWTGYNPGVRLLESDDMVNWKMHSFIIDGSKLPADCPYNGRFWAPEIHFIKNKFYLTVSSGKITPEDPKGMSTHSVWLFVSDAVTGPYKLLNGPLTPQYNNDATLFEDEDGQTYMYCSGNGLFQSKIDLTTGKIIGEVVKFRGAKDEGNPGWMVGGIEGPFVLKRAGVYYMFFSAWTRGYEVGLLKSNSPLGPWELASPEPIFGTRKRKYREEMAKGGGYSNLKFDDTKDPYCETGHNAIFEGPNGKLWSSCHYMLFRGKVFDSSTEMDQPIPQMGIEPLYFRNGIFAIDGPTWTKQKIKY